jgi:hypothetical protein
MPGWLKALLIVLAVVVVLVVGVVVAGVYYVSRHKDAWLARGKEVMTEGRNFGRKSDNQGCVDESVSRYKKEPGLGSVISNSLFMRGCLDASRPTPGFCDEVPKQTEFIKTAQWRISQCRRVDLSSDSNCQNLFTPVQQFCEQKASKSDESSNSNSY